MFVWQKIESVLLNLLKGLDLITSWSISDQRSSIQAWGEEIIAFLLPFHLLRFGVVSFFGLLAKRITSWRLLSYVSTLENGFEEKEQKECSKRRRNTMKMNPENHRFPNTNNRADSSSWEFALKDGWELESWGMDLILHNSVREKNVTKF